MSLYRHVGGGISCEIAHRRMSLGLTNEKSTLVQVLVWDRQATSHYLSQCWPRSNSPYGITKLQSINTKYVKTHDDVIKWKHFPRNWPYVRRIHRSPVNSLHKSQCREALMFSLICVWINVWVNNRKAGDLRRHGAHYDVTVMRVYNLWNVLHTFVNNCNLWCFNWGLVWQQRWLAK